MWDLVAQFLHVCQGLQGLRGLYVRFECRRSGVSRLEAVGRVVRSPRLTAGQGARLQVADAKALAGVLRGAQALHILDASLQFNHSGDGGSKVIVRSLEGKPKLHTLALDLCMNGVEDKGLEALGRLHSLPSLHTPALNLSLNDFGARVWRQ